MDFTKLLFQTGALKVCPADRPFWYTSGMLGPYYVNTHFLYGNETKANDLLKTIDSLKSEPAKCAEKLLEILLKNYTTDEIFRATIDGLLQTLTTIHPADSIDYISGGERRDWIFSLPVAQLLGKPQLTLFKDGTVVTYCCKSQVAGRMSQIAGIKSHVASRRTHGAGCGEPEFDSQDSSVVHIADLLNTASSYERNWLPQLAQNGFTMRASLVVVDRNQGGGAYLNSQTVENIACVTIDTGFFANAAANGHIDNAQLQMIHDYTCNPKQYMKDFLSRHPEYLSTAKNVELSSAVLHNI